MFTAENLKVWINNSCILEDFSISIKLGEVHAVMGPNGAGKSTLASALMGHPRYRVEGKAMLDGKSLLGMTTDERARAGVFLAFQHPEEIGGVSIAKMMQKAVGGNQEKPDIKKIMEMHKEMEAMAEKLGIGKEFLKRELNVGFSGGEKKRNEILQLAILKPKLVIIDEVDSGLDVDGLKTVAHAITDMKDGKRSFLIITHYRRILEYIKPDFVHILARGRIIKSGDYSLAEEIDKEGYGNLLKANE